VGDGSTIATGPIGSRAVRNEDARLLTGRALFVDDVQLPGMLHAAFLRSPHAHARIRSIDTARARALAGVVAVYTADDLGDYWRPGPLLVSPPPVAGAVFHERTQVPLAKDKVRHVGEPIALVVAESRYLAEDALAEIDVDFEPKRAVVDLAAALSSNDSLVHDDLGSNLAAHVVQARGDWQAAKSAAKVLIARRLSYDRGAAAALEGRAVAAAWDARTERLTIWDTTQAPIPIRNGLAAMLGLSEHQVRVVAPFIGGGFGPKIMMFYPEEVVVPWAAMRLGRPVKWTSDRAEDFVSTTQERLQLHDAELALDGEGRILGLSDLFLHDTGAYDPYGLTVALNSQANALGLYRVPAYRSEFRAVFTNKPIVTPYRGAGRQHGTFVVERLLDFAAKELGLDRIEIRRRNLLSPEEFPVEQGIVYQDFTELTYDSGDYAPLFERALELVDYERFVAEEQPRRRLAGRRSGIGVVAYVEGTGIGPFEGARVQVQTSGKVTVATGVGTQGQGHFTSFAQIAAEALGVAVTDVEVVTGDTDVFHWGSGTFASRGAVVAGSAVHEAASAVAAKARAVAARLLELPESEIELASGVARARHDAAREIGLRELARRANPLRGAVSAGAEPGLEATRYFGPERGATAAGVHAMVVEVDPETMAVAIERYAVVHDCGRVLNPTLVEGQVHGGVAQGIGNAFYEQLVFDDAGQLLNGSFMDFLLPTSLDVPRIDVDHKETPSPLNPLGTKGAGEAGAIPVGALFAQAVEDAFALPGFEIREIPLSPNRLFELVSEHGREPTRRHDRQPADTETT
jgi:carbon-monoxide dehydrogenase large subunit